MPNISKILESEKVHKKLLNYGVLDQYKRGKINVLAGVFSGLDFKLRKPKKQGIWLFRINKKFRALCFRDGEKLSVFDIDDHQ